jgi:4-hydroxy-3-polyprenylbenzoate decarboxylase
MHADGKGFAMTSSDLVMAVTGASGSPYAVRLLELLLRAKRVVHLVISPAATEVFEQELGIKLSADVASFNPLQFLGSSAEGLDLSLLKFHNHRDFRAGIASGSFPTAGMVICPCSMGTVASIAHGISQNLIHRAADVHLKERRKLILVPRETPLGVIQLRNLTQLAEAGATILPAMPGFYNKPQSIGELVDFVVGRICDQLGVECSLTKRWGC